MARNPVQFQKGISLNEFLSLYGTEQQCFDALYRWRWPDGVVPGHLLHDPGQERGIGDGARPRACALRVLPARRCLPRGRARTGAPGKTPFVAAVETNEAGHPQRVKLTVVEGFRLTEIAAWAQVLSDGLACFNGVTAAGCVHEPMVTGGGKATVERPEFRWVNTTLGNIKNALRDTYHAVRPKYAQRYLAEFEYRFNRRFDLPDIIPRLVYVALRTPPMPERLLKLRLA